MILEQNSELGRPILSPHTAQVRLLSDRREGKKTPQAAEKTRMSTGEKKNALQKGKSFQLIKRRWSGDLIIIAPSGENPTD